MAQALAMPAGSDLAPPGAALAADLPPVSVVMPVHNNARFVGDAVRSVLSQSFANFELLIGDDGSDDGSSQILAGLAGDDARIRIVRRSSASGVANAINWVVAAARHDLIALAHADDISYPDRLAREVAILASARDAVLVGAPADGLDTAGRVVHPPNLWRVIRPRGMASFSHSSIMFRREAFVAAGGYRPAANYWEDLDLYWRMASLGRVMVVPRALTGYRYSGDSIRSRDQEDEVEHAVQRMYERAALVADVGALGATDAPPQTVAEKLRPRVFVARAWVDVWNGRPTRALPRLMRRAKLRPNWETIEAFAFLVWASVSPRSLRWSLRRVVGATNAFVARRIDLTKPVEWRPF